MERLNPSEVEKKLLAGERVSNPIVGWNRANGDSWPRFLYPYMVLRVISINLKREIIQDFDTEEIYLK